MGRSDSERQRPVGGVSARGLPTAGHWSLATVLTLLLALPAWGQGVAARPAGTPFPAGPVRLSVTAGVGLPSDDVFRDVYGSTVVPIGGQVDWRIGTSGFGLFGGLRWVSTTGEAIADDAAVASGERLEFAMMSWRVGPSWSVLRGPWGFGAGAGLTYNSYREEWESAGLRVEDSGIGAVFQGNVERRFTRRLSALVRLEYALFEIDPPEDTGLGSVALGGLDITAGIGFRF